MQFTLFAIFEVIMFMFVHSVDYLNLKSPSGVSIIR